MAFSSRSGPCVVCGVHVERNRASVTAHRCQDCLKAAALDAADQMRNKSGPAWDKWLAAMEKAVARQREAAGVRPPG